MKRTIRLLTASLLAAAFGALFLFACTNPLMPPPRESGNGVPEGKGIVRINTGLARTAMPTTAFNHYEYWFSSDGAAPVQKPPVENRFELDPGSWTVTVKAYAGTEADTLAAEGTSEAFAITSGQDAGTISVTLHAVTGEGAGTLSYTLTYPAGVTVESFTLTLLAGDSPIDLLTGSVEGETDPLSRTGTETGITAGYYLAQAVLAKGGITSGKSDVVHIYNTLNTPLEWTFTAEYFTVSSILVSSGADSGPGSLRHAIDNAAPYSTIVIDSKVGTIRLNYTLQIIEDLTIQGNGVTITPSASWIGNNSMLYTGSDIMVNISRVHFKDGRKTWENGAAISAGNTILNLESCIFSGNQAERGGAIYNYDGTLTVKGCTFYGNSASGDGGAIYNAGGTVTLTGNLFYGNTAGSYPVVYDATSYGYNAANVAFGTGTAQSGWTAGTGDTTISAMPVSPLTFRVISGSGAENVITTLPEDYPTVDFYGNAVTAGAAAGAVQASVSGHYLDLSVNSSASGSVTASPQPDEDGLVSGSVTITADPSANSSFVYWLVDGVKSGDTSNPLELNVMAHTTVQAVFSRVVRVNNLGDTNGSASNVTLRYALTNAEDGDIIRFSAGLVQPGTSVIALNSLLPYITKSITIEGNGVTITPGASWTGRDSMLYVGVGGVGDSITVNISRVHFKDGLTVEAGAAICLMGDGTAVNLESCIFSGNQTNTTEGGGGAIFNFEGSLTVKGCTFYGNSTSTGGGAILNYYGTAALTGNLFYGNTDGYGYPVVGNIDDFVTSGVYNVVDAALGTNDNESGWTAGTGDKNINVLPVSPLTFRLLSLSGATNVITTLPEDYPTVDFYGNDITNGAAAGAVQEAASGSGYVLDLSVNSSASGSVTASPPPDEDGLVSGSVTITADPSANSSFVYWLVDVDGVKSVDTSNPRTFTMTVHTTVQAVFSRVVRVTNLGDTNGSASTVTLRYALANAEDGNTIRFSEGLVQPGTSVIALNSPLPIITKSITIEGNGVTITPGASWSGDESMLGISSIGKTVNISRVHFKDGLTGEDGAAIYVNDRAALNLESCIFSGNQADYGGGAIYNYGGTLTVKGCTFYGNSALAPDVGGGVIFNTGTVTLTGNLFYGNTAANYPVVRNSYSSVTSGGYNVVDAALGASNDQSGWTAGAGDKTISAMPVSPLTFRLLSGSGAANVLTTLPSGYPAVDFYGNAVTAGAAAGAVQASASGSGHYLGLSVNNSDWGSVAASPSSADGLFSGNVSITATPSANSSFDHWLVNGVKSVDTSNPLELDVTAHTTVQAVFTGHSSGISNISYSGTWTLQSGGRYQSPVPAYNGTTKKARVSFTTTAGNALILIQLEVSSEKSFDFAFISTLDNASAAVDDITETGIGTYPGSVISGEATVTIAIPVPTAGRHFIDIGYQKDHSSSGGSDRAWFKVLE
ncbi:hypothetical protein AGMMS49928_17880 [Spirochaetia bacterium]|nr:hypothetical protein AGMMS49928_17880 [Spirochaetia bacterium]